MEMIGLDHFWMRLQSIKYEKQYMTIKYYVFCSILSVNKHIKTTTTLQYTPQQH
eukprot:UN10508